MVIRFIYIKKTYKKKYNNVYNEYVSILLYVKYITSCIFIYNNYCLYCVLLFIAVLHHSKAQKYKRVNYNFR